LDELGRGTATFDGTAIAYAVVEHLVGQTGCRTLFATHYHSLIDDLEMDPRVKLGHMECFVQQPETDDNNDSNPSHNNTVTKHKEGEEVTFLFRLCDGSSPKSYGINVARLAGLPPAVIQIALRQSEKFESQMKAAERSELQSVTVQSKGTSSFGQSQKILVLNKRRREKVQAYFEKLISLAGSTVPVAELAYYARELWRRYFSVHTSFEADAE